MRALWSCLIYSKLPEARTNQGPPGPADTPLLGVMGVRDAPKQLNAIWMALSCRRRSPYARHSQVTGNESVLDRNALVITGHDLENTPSGLDTQAAVVFPMNRGDGANVPATDQLGQRDGVLTSGL